ncbi:MAG: GNAT family N-acetyltransferase [Prevotella sp.]|nr:GNAT family N-acetyltransferase [Prevotella sp.]
MFDVVRYTQDKASEWNAFVEDAKNATFLFNRGYMDYHADRFDDHSLMLYRNGRLFALLPANERGDTIYSHQGLTYGGLVTDKKAVASTVCEAVDALNGTLRHEGFRRVIYKPLPWIYQQMPAEEDLYAIFVKCNARLIERDVSSTICLSRRLRFEESRRSGIRKALRQGLTVCESKDLNAFWDILMDNLARQYKASPVHSVDEMHLLMRRFPDNIRLFMVYDDQHAVAGTLLYITPQVVHTQYISASPKGKSLGALDLLFDQLINGQKFSQPYFDFGTSALADTCEINKSLIFQKQGFGGRGVCYDWYEWTL